MDRFKRMLAREIKKEREERKWSQVDLGERVGVAGATVSRWENTDLPDFPNRDNLLALADVLDWSMAGNFLRDLLDAADERRIHGRVFTAVAQLEPGDGRRADVGAHTVELLEDGALLVNGHVRIDPE